MEIITIKSDGGEVRNAMERGGSQAGCTPTAVVAWAGDGEVVLVVRDSEVDSPVAMHRAATVERERRLACQRIEQRRRRRLENRKVNRYG